MHPEFAGISAIDREQLDAVVLKRYSAVLYEGLCVSYGCAVTF